MKNTLTFTPEGKHFRVKETGNLCSLPKMGKVVTIDNYSVEIGHSAHPNIDSSGSVKGMKELGYWNKNDKTVKQGGFIYNVSKTVCTDLLDELCLAIENGPHKCDFLTNGTRIYRF